MTLRDFDIDEPNDDIDIKRDNGQKIDHVQERSQEGPFRMGARESEEKLECEPTNAYGLDDLEDEATFAIFAILEPEDFRPPGTVTRVVIGLGAVIVLGLSRISASLERRQGADDQVDNGEAYEEDGEAAEDLKGGSEGQVWLLGGGEGREDPTYCSRP